jgi:hypothetical protein
MQLLNAILPWITSAFALWCAAGLVRTAIEIWKELRPAPAARPRSEPVPLHRPEASPLRNAA